MRFCALPLLGCSALSRAVATQYHRASRPRHARALPRIATLCYALPERVFAMPFPDRASPCESMPQHCRSTPCETMPKLCFTEPKLRTGELFCAVPLHIDALRFNAHAMSCISLLCLSPSYSMQCLRRSSHRLTKQCRRLAWPSYAAAHLCPAMQCRSAAAPCEAIPSRSKSSLCLSLTESVSRRL